MLLFLLGPLEPDGDREGDTNGKTSTDEDKAKFNRHGRSLNQLLISLAHPAKGFR